MINCLAYIDLNPLRAGLVHRPEEYRWNSLAAGANAHEHQQMTCADRSENPKQSPVHIGGILDHMMPSKRERIPPGCNRPAQQNMVNGRILRLEQKVDRLTEKKFL